MVDNNHLIYKRISEILGGNLPYISTILLSLGLIFGLASFFSSNRYITIALTEVSVSLAFVGGFLEFYVLITLNRARSLILRSRINTFKLIGKIVLIISLFYLLIGIFLIDREYRSTLEYLLERPVRDSECGKYYNLLLHLISLGLSSASFHSCSGKLIASLLFSDHVSMDESLVGFSS